jgi:TM2 domain-containing membrane protein YozV
VADEWYYSEAGEQRGPIPLAELKQRAAAGKLGRGELIWTDGMADWKPAGEVRGIFDGGPVIVHNSPPVPPDVSSKKLAAGICAILLGSFGVHKFILGYTTQGVILLVLFLVTCGIAAAVTSVTGIIEGIVYLTKSDEDFYRTYMVGRKEWF